MKIGFDLDGVLYPWHEYFYKYVSRRIEKYEGMGYEKFWTTMPNLDDENSEWLHHILIKPSLYSQEPIDKNLLTVLEELSKNNELYYITCRAEELCTITKSWVHRNKLPQKENLYILSDSKRELVSNLKLDYYVEDRLEYYNELKDITKVVLIRKPWNDYGKGIRLSFDDTLDALIYLLNRSNL